MSKLISASVIGGENVIRKFGLIPLAVRRRLMLSVNGLAIKVSNKVKFEKLSGQVLNVQTGRLRRSIRHEIMNQPNAVIATVGTNVEYAKLHEYGGKTTRQRIMPERSFLRSALRELKGEIISELEQSAKVTVKDLMK